MTKVNLNDKKLGKGGWESLRAKLEEYENITTLLLSRNQIEDEVAIELFLWLKENAPNLNVLDLSCNIISDKAAASISECIGSMLSLEYFLLNKNQIGDEGLNLILPSLSEKLLINLNHNYIREEGAKKVISHLLTHKTQIHLSSGNHISESMCNIIDEHNKNHLDAEVLLSPSTIFEVPF